MAQSSKILTTYLALTQMIGPAYRLAVARRLQKGKEHPQRSSERFGQASRARPGGKLIWMHAASVGETQSLLRLIPEILAVREDVSILLTSGTVTSAALLERDLPDRAFHQFTPIDTPRVMRRFLDHWKPDLAVWVESEIWPRMLVETKRRNIPMMLMSARVSARAFQRWRFARRAAKSLFSMFDRILVQDNATFDILAQLGISESDRVLTGSLKSELAPALPQSPDTQEILGQLQSRACWLAASTHDGEEEHVLAAHKALDHGQLLVLAPRHPQRGPDVADLAREAGFSVACRSAGEALMPGTQVYVADTIGEMGLWYRATSVAFVGGSLVATGGHNPFEPILLDTAVISGPNTKNFADAYRVLGANQAFQQVADSAALAEAVRALSDPQKNAEMVARARDVLGTEFKITTQVRDHVLAMLAA